MFEQHISLFSFEPIGVIHSVYKEKFTIPRQPGLATTPATIEIYDEFARPEAFRGLEEFSHIWVSFVFHAALQQSWKPTVRPPRLGGNQRVGVFASRSMFRPNPIGLSVVRLEKVDIDDRGIRLEVSGGDFLDKTPVLDIKPYLVYADAIVDAKSSYAAIPPGHKYQVIFSSQAENSLALIAPRIPRFRQMIIEILQLDPRPAYIEDDQRSYAAHIMDYDVKWTYSGKQILVTAIVDFEQQ